MGKFTINLFPLGKLSRTGTYWSEMTLSYRFSVSWKDRWTRSYCDLDEMLR